MSGVGLAVWGDERGLVAELESLAGKVAVARVCEDFAEVLAALASGVARAAVMAGPTSEIGADFLDTAQRCAARILVLTDDVVEGRRVRALGASVLSAAPGPQRIVAWCLGHEAAPGLLDPAESTVEVAAPLPQDAADPGRATSDSTTATVSSTASGASTASALALEPTQPAEEAEAMAPPPAVSPGPEHTEESGGTRSRRAKRAGRKAPAWFGRRTTGVRRAAGERDASRPGHETQHQTEPAPPSPGGPSSVGQARDAEPSTSPSGEITVVWGTGGAPGRSTIAANLAVERALLGRRVVLVDADSYGASLAAMLGLLDETAGLVRLCRAVEAGTFDPTADDAACARIEVAGTGLDFVSGLPRPQRWAEISAHALRRALAVLAQSHDDVIVDVAAPIFRDEDLALDTFAPQRNDAALAALEGAHRVLVVGLADAVGLPRLLRLCEEALEAQWLVRPEIVINQLRRQASGARPERALRVAWRRFGPQSMTPRHLLPWDPEAADAALLGGTALAESAPRSPLRVALQSLAATPNAPVREGTVSNPPPTPRPHAPVPGRPG